MSFLEGQGCKHLNPAPQVYTYVLIAIPSLYSSVHLATLINTRKQNSRCGTAETSSCDFHRHSLLCFATKRSGAYLSSVSLGLLSRVQKVKIDFLYTVLHQELLVAESCMQAGDTTGLTNRKMCLSFSAEPKLCWWTAGFWGGLKAFLKWEIKNGCTCVQYHHACTVLYRKASMIKVL